MSRWEMPPPSPGDPYGLVALQIRTHQAMLRWSVSFGIVVALVTIPVSAANGTPTALAVAVGGALALVQLVVWVRVDLGWGLWLGGVCALALFWPSIVLLPWLFFAGLYALAYLMLIVSIEGDRRKDRRK